MLTNVDQCGPMWTNVNQCGPMLTNVNQCGPVLTNVDQCGPMWTNVNQCWPMWTNVDQCWPMLTSVDQCGPMWTNVDQCWPMRLKTYVYVSLPIVISRQLIAPQTSVLDCSIATVLWFAARGAGKLLNDGSMYTSPARVILSGLGADELLGGYSRHRTAFERGGDAAVNEELRMDVRRIGSRNCGRDDRVISDHGREARYPFLDENLVDFLMRSPVRLRCRLDWPRGLGDKLLLRLFMHWLGYSAVAGLEKRAMQFGSRIAKIDHSKKGSDSSPYLWQKNWANYFGSFCFLKGNFFWDFKVQLSRMF